MSVIPRKLDAHVNWRNADVQDAAKWTLVLTPDDHAELGRALNHAKAKSNNLLDLTREDFPLDGLTQRLAEAERELIDGRGFIAYRCARHHPL